MSLGWLAMGGAWSPLSAVCRACSISTIDGPVARYVSGAASAAPSTASAAPPFAAAAEPPSERRD